MCLEKAFYCQHQIGPGGRYCACCSPIPQILKKLEHRKARRLERKQIKEEMESENENQNSAE